jgi:hypothetical protein
MLQMSCHAWYHVKRGTFMGYVRVHDGTVTHTRSTHILRNNRVDALADAAWFAKDLRATHHTTSQERDTV